MSNNNNNVAAPPLPPRNALSSDNLAPPDLPPRNTRPRSSSDTTAIRFSSFQHSPSTLSNVVDGDNTTTSSNLTPETKPIDNHKNNNKRNSNNSADAMAAAYLERHVREMKRASVAGLARPIRRNYEKRNEEDGSVQVNWKEYFEAWIQYIISSFASGQVDEQLEPFSLKVVKSGVDRLYGMAAPLKEPALAVRKIYRWENRWITGSFALGYLTLWYYDLLVAFFFAACIGYILSIRLDLLAQFGVEALATAAEDEEKKNDDDNDNDKENENNEDEDENGDKKKKKGNKHTKQFWKRLKNDLGSTDLNYGFTALETKSMNEWRSDIMRKYGPTGQLLFMDILDRLERVKNLLTWKRPEKTRMLLWILFAMAVTLSFLPTRYMTKLVFFWIGIEFFVLQSLRSHYKRHRRLFNIIDWVLWGVPNDAEYAMEVLRLHRKAEDDELHQNGGKSVKESKRLWRQSGNNNGSEENQEQEEGKHQQATSTAATLAIMVAGAAAGQVKQALDEQFERTRNSQDQDSDSNSSVEASGHSTQIKPSSSMSDLFERKGSQKNLKTDTENESEILETYGCVYRGSIPGRIVLTTQGLQFRTSRVTGAKILVYYYWRDIVSVRKSKSIDIFVWHTNGLDITTVDGEQLHFDNVIKRDDCFNRLVAAAGDRWG